MSSHPNYNSGRSRPTSDPHSGQSYPDQGLSLNFTSTSLASGFPSPDVVPNNSYTTQQRPTDPAQHHYQPAQQQTQAPYAYSSYPPPLSEQSKHYSTQAYGPHNRVSPSFSSAYPQWHPPPPLGVPQEGWQGQGSQYCSKHADLQIQHTSDDMYLPHAAYPMSSYPPYQSQHQSLSATTCSAGHQHGPPPPVETASQQYHQHQPMSTSQRTIPSPRTSTQLRHSCPDNKTEGVVLPKPSEPVIKKRFKRANANQMEVLNAAYACTAFPSTEERAALAKELDMSARSVQTWFQDKRQHSRQGRRNTAGTSSNPVTVPPPVRTPTPPIGYRGTGSPMSVSPVVETPGPTYSSRSPLPSSMTRSGRTPSPPSGRPDYSRDWPRSGY